MSAQPQTKPATGTDTVTVACKIPQGLVLQLFEKRLIKTQGSQGVTEEMRHFPIGGEDDPDRMGEFRIAGSAHAQNEGPRCRTVGAFAITEGVPKEFWETWMEQTGKYHPAVRKGLLSAYSSTSRAVDAAKERRKEVTGLERINPNKIPQIDKKVKVEMSPEQGDTIGHIEE